MIKLNRKGQTLVEYVLIIGLITVVAIGAVKIFGGYLQDEITKVGCNISGKKYIEKKNDKGKRIIGEAYCEGDEGAIISDKFKLYE